MAGRALLVGHQNWNTASTTGGFTAAFLAALPDMPNFSRERAPYRP